MKRIAAHLLAFASFAIFVAMLIACVRGGWVDRRASRHLIGKWYYVSDGGSYQNLVQVILFHEQTNWIIGPQLGPDGVFTPACDAWRKQFAPQKNIVSGSFRVEYGTTIGTDAQHRLFADGERIGIMLPFWAAVSMWATLPAIIWVILPIHRRLRKRELIARSAAPLIAPSEFVSADQPCIHCGYNLRTLKLDGPCPECGAPVAQTIGAKRDLSQAPSQWLKKLAVANALLLLSRIALAATYAAAFQRNGAFVGEYVAAVVFAAVTILSYLFGALLLTTGADSISPGDSVARKFRRLAMISIAILLAGTLYQVVFTLVAPRSFGLMGSVSVDWYWGSTGLVLVGWILYCGCIVREFLFLSQLLRRIPNPLLASYCKIAGIALALSSLMLPYMVRDILEQWQAFNLIETAAVAIWFIALAWAGSLNLGSALQFARLSRREAHPQLTKKHFDVVSEAHRIHEG